MYEVSDGFKSAVYAPIRTAKGRVTLDISDIRANGDVSSITTTTEALISNKSQLINKKREQSYNLATYEPNRLKLDGSFCFADDLISNNKEIGFCSDVLCGADGTFIIHPAITFQFNNSHSSMGLTVTFDRLNGEYATDFNITAYDSNNSVITSVDVTRNTEVLCTPVGQLYNYRKVVVTIKKWNVGYRRARICEIDFGIVRVYQDNNIIRMSLVEELDLTTSTVPSAEFKFTVDNTNREFNILNPSGFFKYLQQRQQVTAEIGIETGSNTEFIPLGNYLLLDWTSDEGSLTASFTARSNLDLMSGYDYENLMAKTNYSLYQMAVDIFYICGISNYEIDAALQNIFTNALVEKTDCKSVLQMIAIAGCANIYVTRDNTIRIKVSYANIDTSIDTMGLDNMYIEPQIQLDKVVKSVEVTYYSNINTKSIVSVSNIGITSGDTLKLESNNLINNETQARNVANWILNQKNFRAIYNANWRGNPAHELNDIVAIEDGYQQNQNAIITKNEINYEGYLSAKTEARGKINNTV